jgi:hypothetical protein
MVLVNVVITHADRQREINEVLGSNFVCAESVSINLGLLSKYLRAVCSWNLPFKLYHIEYFDAN